MDFFKLGKMIKEPELKSFAEHRLVFDLEFRETVQEDDKPAKLFCLVITHIKNDPQIFYTQKSKIRLFSPDAAIKWVRQLGYKKMLQIRTDLPPHQPDEAGKYPTLLQIREKEFEMEWKHKLQSDDQLYEFAKNYFSHGK